MDTPDAPAGSSGADEVGRPMLSIVARRAEMHKFWPARRLRAGYFRSVDQGHPLRVGVVSGHPLIRVGVTSLLQSVGDVARVVETAAETGHAADADVVVYDLAAVVDEAAPLPGRLDARDDLEHLVRRVPVVGLTRDGREDLDEAS